MKKDSAAKTLLSSKDAFPIKPLRTALKTCGDYVYAYYGKKSGLESPFYVGKGRGDRVLAHWLKAVSPRPDSELASQEIEIRKILQDDRLPTVKLLAYNVEYTSPEKIYSLVERVVQDAFGIQKVWQKRPGLSDRVVKVPTSTLVQVREDSAGSPVLSLDALIGLRGERVTVDLDELVALVGAPVLLVGLMRTYHPSYSSNQLAQMARMYWNLNKFQKTSLPALRTARNAVLLAWRTLDGKPTIVGAWRIRKGSLNNTHNAGRYSMALQRPDLELRRDTIGLHLTGTGANYMGPRIILPEA